MSLHRRPNVVLAALILVLVGGSFNDAKSSVQEQVFMPDIESCTDTRPQVWLGDATSECNLDSSYCAMFGLDYVCSADYIFPHPCSGAGVTDQNVLCASPDKTLPPATPATTLKVLMYNVLELNYVYYQRGQYERTCRIPQKIFDLYGDVDVIVFNEVFMGGCFPSDGLSLRDILSQYGFVHYTKTVGQDKSLLPFPPEEGSFPPIAPPDVTAIENGGVFIASRWPILKEAQTIYDNSARPSIDALSNKGAMYAKIEKDDGSTKKIYHVLGTHLQSGQGDGGQGDGVRVAQCKEMHTLMEEQNIPSTEPVIYAGDLNTRLDDPDGRWDQTLLVLEANMPEIIGDLNVTYDYENNDIRKDPGTGGKWIDYVIYSNQHLMPNDATQEAIKFVESEPFAPCMQSFPIAQSDEPIKIGPIEIPVPIELGKHQYPYQERCRDSWNITDLSDHYAVMGVFDFSSPIDPVPNPTQEPIPAECTDTRPQVWLGYATKECDLTPDHCAMFGLEYVCSARYNTWDYCYVFPGQNALCAVPEVTLSEPTPATTFKLLAYNVYELRDLYWQNGQHERTCRILPEAFRRHGDIDAIIFDETFAGGCFPMDGASFRQMLEYYDFRYYTGTVGENQRWPPENGGVFIASRWPIVRWDETVYESKIAPSDDALAAKGAVYAEIEKSVDGKTRNYHVLGTHMQSGDHDRGGDEARLNQTKEMHQLMLRQNITKGEAVLYGGDLNNDAHSRPEQLETMLEALRATVPEIVGSFNVTYDNCYNDINFNAGNPQDCAESRGWIPGEWVDYVVYSYDHLLPTSSSLEAIKYVDDEPFDICFDEIKLFIGHLYPYDERCGINITITDLSDHYAVIGRFEYPSEEVSSANVLFSPLLLIIVALLFTHCMP